MDGDLVTVVIPRNPDDPRTPSQKYYTTRVRYVADLAMARRMSIGILVTISAPNPNAQGQAVNALPLYNLKGELAAGAAFDREPDPQLRERFQQS